MAAFLAPLLAGLGSSALGSLFGSGSKVKLPKPITVDPATVQRSALTANRATLPESINMGTNIDLANLLSRQTALSRVMPSLFTEMLPTSMQTYSNMLRGELNPEAISAGIRGEAGRALGSGMSHAQKTSNTIARNLGLQSQQLAMGAATGLPAYASGIANLTIPKPYDITSGFLTNAEAMNAMQGNATTQNQRNMYQAAYNSMPDPMLSSLGGILGNIGGTMTQTGLSRAFATPQTGGYDSYYDDLFYGSGGQIADWS